MGYVMDSNTPSSVPLTDRITTALGEVHGARAARDYSRELSWSQMLDRMLDSLVKLLRGRDAFRPLNEIDPTLSARLTVGHVVRLAPEPTAEPVARGTALEAVGGDDE